MFTGIVEAVGTVQQIDEAGSNKQFWIESPLSQRFKIEQSVSHSGACLTVDAIGEGLHRVTAIAETLSKTDLDNWQVGTVINIERCLPINGRLDGHLVQGHVDTTAVCTALSALEGSWNYRFHFDAKYAHLVIEKGSICINGISLTCFNLGRDTVEVAVIPYTYQHTNMAHVTEGSLVNVEFDLLGKYMARWKQVVGNRAE
jgi:riboflavin synthase